jgi:four helix bundle protein
MELKNKKYDLEDRLIDFGVQIIDVSETVDKKREAGRYLSGQLLRSGTSPALHYGEAQAAESRKDFIHKMKVILKELNETKRNLKMMSRSKLHNDTSAIKSATSECGELIAIFVKSVQTAGRGNRLTEEQRNG